jgi:diguanylate cyclase
MELGQPRAARRLTGRSARDFLVASFACSLLYAVGALGDYGEIVYSAVSVAALGATIYGIAAYRPRPLYAWMLLPATGLLFTVGNAVREGTGQNGDLERSTLLPDLFTAPGYLLFAAMLVMVIRARQAGRSEGLGLDALMFALASMTLFYVGLIAPVLHGSEFSRTAQISFSIYPPFSAFLALLAARLAFIPGRRPETLQYFLLGMLSLFVGDVVQFLAETGQYTPPANLIDLPYALAFSCIGASLLHPSVRRVAQTETEHGPSLATLRNALVMVALVLPASLLFFWSTESTVEKLMVGGMAGTLTLAGSIRLLVATRAQARSEQLFAYRATHDVLTDLPNRELLLEEVARAAECVVQGRGIAVVLLDVDRFRLINDTLGHKAGDVLLRSIAGRATEIVGDRGLVARISGDEVTVLLPDTSLAEALDLAEDIRRRFREPFDAGRPIYLTVSVGVTHTTGRVAEPADLLREADTAMYRAKDAGRDRVTVFDRAMLEVDVRRVELEHALRIAIGAGELEIYFQPIVRISTGRVEGFEALARWQTPTGWIPPIEFVAAAESSGLIDDLGRWALIESCRNLSRLRAVPELAHTSVSVNLSARQLTPELAQIVDDTLRATGLPGEALWLELTESMMVEEDEGLHALFTSIHDLGVRFSLDDFGTGFSSLSYLRRFDLDRLKIDRSFVTGLDQTSAPGSLASAIVSMGESLRIETVAEGVEDAAETMAVWSLGCDLAQGYFFARPMPTREIPQSLARIQELWSALDVPRRRPASAIAPAEHSSR